MQIPLFQGNLGWWIIIIWPDSFQEKNHWKLTFRTYKNWWFVPLYPRLPVTKREVWYDWTPKTLPNPKDPSEQVWLEDFRGFHGFSFSSLGPFSGSSRSFSGVNKNPLEFFHTSSSVPCDIQRLANQFGVESKSWLGGGNSKIFYVHPENWGNDSHFHNIIFFNWVGWNHQLENWVGFRIQYQRLIWCIKPSF